MMFVVDKPFKKDYFYLSGAIALLFYFFCFLLFALYLNSPEVKKFDSFTKSTVLELDIMIMDNSEVKTVKTQQKASKKSHEVVKKSASRSPKQSNNVKSLFSKVKTTSKTILKKEVNNVSKSVVASRFKSKFEKQKKSSSVSVSKLLDNVKTKSSVIASTDSKNNNDPYFSKIYELLAKRWRPMLIIDGLSAKVLVIISSSGEFDYRFIQYSGNERFDDSLKSFLRDQVDITYPPHERGSSQKIAVTFTAKKG